MQRLSRVVALVALVASFTALPAASAFAQINPARNRLDLPVSGVVQNVGTLAGTLSISRSSSTC